MDWIKFYFYYLDSQLTGAATVIRIVIFVVILLLFLYMFSLLRMLIINNGINLNKYHKLKIQRKYEKYIRDIVFSPFNLEAEEIMQLIHFDKDDVKKKWQKESLTKLMLLIKDDAALTNVEMNINNYNEILYIFRLETYWENEITTGKTRRKMYSIRKLEELATSVVSGTVASLLHHRNDNLRKLARSEYIKFGEQDAFKYLEEEDFDRKFNRLDEIKLHDSMKQKSEKHVLPLLAQWVQNAKNDDFKCFLIREIAFFNQFESAPYLLEIFKENTNNKVLAEIARTLGLLKYENALPVFISQFKLCRLSVQSNIIDAIGNIGKKESVNFLIDIYDDVYNNEMKLKVMEAMQKCGDKNANIKEKQIEKEKKKIMQYQE